MKFGSLKSNLSSTKRKKIKKINYNNDDGVRIILNCATADGHVFAFISPR